MLYSGKDGSFGKIACGNFCRPGCCPEGAAVCEAEQAGRLMVLGRSILNLVPGRLRGLQHGSTNEQAGLVPALGWALALAMWPGDVYKSETSWSVCRSWWSMSSSLWQSLETWRSVIPVFSCSTRRYCVRCSSGLLIMKVSPGRAAKAGTGPDRRGYGLCANILGSLESHM